MRSILNIRKAIYTTNVVESLNSVIRRVIKKRNVFPTDESVFKVIWLAMKAASKKWIMPIQNRKQAMNRFMIDFGDPQTKIQLCIVHLIRNSLSFVSWKAYKVSTVFKAGLSSPYRSVSSRKSDRTFAKMAGKNTRL